MEHVSVRTAAEGEKQPLAEAAHVGECVVPPIVVERANGGDSELFHGPVPPNLLRILRWCHVNGERVTSGKDPDTV